MSLQPSPLIPLPEFTLDIDTVGLGGVALAPPGGVYTQGTQVILTATADQGHQFLNWSGDLISTQTPDTIIVAADMNVIATFAPSILADSRDSRIWCCHA